MGKFCLYSDSCEKAPCLSIRMRKYPYLRNFINDESTSNEKSFSVPLIIECLKLSDGHFSIIDPKCINCMFCVFGCIGNRILINKRIHPEQMCVDITYSQLEELKTEFLPKFFHGEFIKLPQVPLSQIKAKYKTFEAFTSVDETKNIAVWAANAMKYLSSSLEPRVSLEVGLIIEDRDRGGRLDISLLNVKDKYLYVAETKVTFESMMGEQRYEAQMVAYESELKSICPPNIKRCKFLLIGGKESDLLPFESKNSTGGNNSKLFYDVLKNRHLFFISANALLALGLMKMFVSQELYSLEHLYPIMTNPNYLGIVSSGVVTSTHDIISFEKIHEF
jgi:hypothetical protein